MKISKLIVKVENTVNDKLADTLPKLLEENHEALRNSINRVKTVKDI